MLEFSDAEAATRLLDDDEKLNLLVVGSGQRRNMIHISESGLYHLLLQSRKPKAKPFRRRVTMGLRAQNRLKIEKKCAGECTVLKFICMFAVLSLLLRDGITVQRIAYGHFLCLYNNI